MKMPNYEKLRNRKTGIFKPRQPTAPTGNLFWKALNSPFTLWMLTAVVGTVVTFTYTNLQSCFKQTDEKIREISRFQYELNHRNMGVALAGMNATSIADLRQRLSAVSPILSEYKETSLFQLEASRIEYGQLVVPNKEYDNEVIAMYRANPIERNIFSSGLVYGQIPPEMPDTFLPKYKEIAFKFAKYVELSEHMMRRWGLARYCTIPNAFQGLWREQHQIFLRAKRDPQPDNIALFYELSPNSDVKSLTSPPK